MNMETDNLSIDQLAFNEAGLIPAIIQDAHTKEVLMLAWMDKTALQRTLDDRDVWFYSRSRQRYWRKGEESGNTLRAREISYDCDADALLISCELAGEGVACHTGKRSCFYRTL